jgi:uncharacterized NAD(P)/FAD-binding protein YdhS
MQEGSATIAIIGGGFCGTVLAANLLRRPPSMPTRILLFERRPGRGCGVAYAPSAFPFQLNVPAGRMSASSYEPQHLLDYARRRMPEVDTDTYLTRQFYGEYLRDFLLAAELAAPLHVRLERIEGEVMAVQPLRAFGPLQVQLPDQCWHADQVVLASGDPSPATRPYAMEVAHLPSYVRHPYCAQAVGGSERSVLLVGSGLTMIDVAVAAATQMPALQIHALSRHGRLPSAQPLHSHPPVLDAQTDTSALAKSRSLRQAVKAVRRVVRNVVELGGDWREAITHARDHVQTLWKNFDHAERRRFLRHVRVYWDTQRHRMPPVFAAHIAQMRRSGQLVVHAGRIRRLHAEGAGIAVRWRSRGTCQDCDLHVDRVIDCTGSDCRLERTTDALWRQLLDAGLVQPDLLGLGLRTGRLGTLIDASGRHSEQLFYLGPMLRASYWEATAVGELRVRAEALAAGLAGRQLGSERSATDAA